MLLVVNNIISLQIKRMKYFKQFIAGSSILVAAPFYYGFHTLKRAEYSYFHYTFLVPIWWGLWNVMSLVVAEAFSLSTRMRFLLVSLITYALAVTYTTYNNVYDFSLYQWYGYYFLMLTTYLIMWNVVVYFIEKLI